MNDNQRGALLSFAYNLGAAFYGGRNFNTITRILRDQKWHEVPKVLEMYRNPGTKFHSLFFNLRVIVLKFLPP